MRNGGKRFSSETSSRAKSLKKQIISVRLSNEVKAYFPGVFFHGLDTN